jgi:hypothetical protein
MFFISIFKEYFKTFILRKGASQDIFCPPLSEISFMEQGDTGKGGKKQTDEGRRGAGKAGNEKYTFGLILRSGDREPQKGGARAALGQERCYYAMNFSKRWIASLNRSTE